MDSCWLGSTWRFAVPLVLLLGSRDEAYLRGRGLGPADTSITSPPPVTRGDSDPKGERVSFDWCNGTDEFSVQENVVISANAPAFVATGWRRFCPAAWQLAGLLHAGGWAPTPSSIRAQKSVDLGLILSIALQWFLLGAFPLKGLSKLREPGMLITLCSAIAFVLVFIPPLRWFAQLPVLISMVTWLCWLGLAFWRVLRSGWKWKVRRLKPT